MPLGLVPGFDALSVRFARNGHSGHLFYPLSVRFARIGHPTFPPYFFRMTRFWGTPGDSVRLLKQSMEIPEICKSALTDQR